MNFKKAEMAKTLKNGLSMIKTNPLNHNWSHFVILLGLTLNQFQKKLLLSKPHCTLDNGEKSWLPIWGLCIPLGNDYLLIFEFNSAKVVRQNNFMGKKILNQCRKFT